MIKNTNKLLGYFGNILILGSNVGFIFLFYPIFMMYFFPPKIPSKEQISSTYSVVIPKISAYSPIISEVDPWNESLYMQALKKGIAQARGTETPDKKGSIFLFAHSSGNPFEMNKYNTIFFRLAELNYNDLILISYKGKEYRYKVFDKKEVWPNEVKYLNDAIKSEKDQLILQTCTPIGTSLKRLLVFAKPL